MSTALSEQQSKFSASGRSAFSLYKELMVGSQSSWFQLLTYELITDLGISLPGIFGLGFRSIAYPLLLAKCGRRPAIGRGVVLRRPAQIELGKRVIVDDYCALDVRGAAGRIHLGDHVTIGRFSSITSKDANVVLASGVNVSSHCRIASMSKVQIGESTLIAAYVYIGPGNHIVQEGQAMISQGMEIRGGVDIGKHCWIGAHSVIMDGVRIGDGAIVGANSFVKEDVPAGAVVAGSPARIIRQK